MPWYEYVEMNTYLHLSDFWDDDIWIPNKTQLPDTSAREVVFRREARPECMDGNFLRRRNS